VFARGRAPRSRRRPRREDDAIRTRGGDLPSYARDRALRPTGFAVIVNGAGNRYRDTATFRFPPARQVRATTMTTTMTRPLRVAGSLRPVSSAFLVEDTKSIFAE